MGLATLLWAASCSGGGHFNAGTATTTSTSPRRVLAGQLSPGIHVAGTLREAVGLVPSRGVPGEVIAVARNGHRFTFAALANGAFNLWLDPGVYRVVGYSPLFEGGKIACRSSGAVTVMLHHAPVVNVVCDGP